jgi:hypothetical protein
MGADAAVVRDAMQEHLLRILVEREEEARRRYEQGDG